MTTQLKPMPVERERRRRSDAVRDAHRLSAFTARPQLSNSGVCRICTASSGAASM